MSIGPDLHQDQDFGRLVVSDDRTEPGRQESGGLGASETMEAETTTVASFQMAIKNRSLNGDLLFHSDRGVQYAYSAFRE